MNPRAHHFGITVSDLDRSIEFYRNVFELEVADRFAMDPDAFAGLLGVSDGRAEVAFLDGAGFRLELEEHAGSATNVNDDTEPDDVGYPHFCFEIEDVQEFYREFQDEIEFVSPPGRASDSGATICYLRDPDGNLVELIESPSA